MKKYSSWVFTVLSIVAILFAVLPLFGPRFIPTHDGEYHIIRFWQFYTMLSSGHWFPRWAPDLNGGFGIPLFTFQYPFPNYVGSFFHFLGLSFVDSVKWTLGAGYVVAMAFCFLWLRRLFGNIPASIGTIVGAYVPYWFLDLYVRGSVGEVWALAWVFGGLAAISYNNRFLLSLCVGLLILSHNIMALIFTPLLLLYIVITDGKLVPSALLGIGIASYFWIPALYEQQFIVGLNPVNVLDHLPELYQLLIPSWGTGFRGAIGGGTEMSYQIGIVPLVVLALSVLQKKRQWFFILSFLFAVFLMHPWLSLFWRLAPFLHVVQYPWRLLSVIVVATPIFTASIARQYRFAWVLALLAVTATFGYSRPVTYEPRSDAHYLSQASFTQGTSSLGDAFQTIWFTEDANVEIASLSVTYVAHVAYYPGWRASVDGREVAVTRSENGLVSFPVPAGEHTTRIWLGLTWWQKASAALSVLSLFVATVSFILKKRT